MKNKEQRLKQVGRVYDSPFVVEEKKTVQDDNGIVKEQWVKKYKLFADGKNLYGREYELARQRGNVKTVKFIIKAGPKIDESMRIIFDSKIYDIDNIDNIGFKNEEVEIKAIERVLDI